MGMGLWDGKDVDPCATLLHHCMICQLGKAEGRRGKVGGDQYYWLLILVKKDYRLRLE